eukprot:1161785-Pelagomonas_calceolata.AAC.3
MQESASSRISSLEGGQEEPAMAHAESHLGSAAYRLQMQSRGCKVAWEQQLVGKTRAACNCGWRAACALSWPLRNRGSTACRGARKAYDCGCRST